MTVTRWAFDVGRARIGAARTPAGTTVVLPAGTFQVDKNGAYWHRIVDALHESPASVIYVGLPLHLNGNQGASVKLARNFAKQLHRRYPTAEIRMIDERLTTSTAHLRLADAGISGRNRTQIIDQAAAAVILEYAIASEGPDGQFSGELFAAATEERNNG
ncbi:hypothetical protein BSR29_04510 [Boudabousia liubingyangii]|uniref:Putative pre-16S rRNA nuclease n=1 Tax=Boudabousia liubingyangii TaxID=1921764 RepID=A0A1Q5PNU3_9ACTO|nr:Holliday junction resolvase RuvX [Boudabousia liubingyangii]OKL47674.1 hypothetical protein BSR28_04075 [Boudabousia liubingyangii]OKL49100.1 hypothetical protein BSR29_04510 [Boudabousia liubingyangii]